VKGIFASQFRVRVWVG